MKKYLNFFNSNELSKIIISTIYLLKIQIISRFILSIHCPNIINIAF